MFFCQETVTTAFLNGVILVGKTKQNETKLKMEKTKNKEEKKTDHNLASTSEGSS